MHYYTRYKNHVLKHVSHLGNSLYFDSRYLLITHSIPLCSTSGGKKWPHMHHLISQTLFSEQGRETIRSDRYIFFVTGGGGQRDYGFLLSLTFKWRNTDIYIVR